MEKVMLVSTLLLLCAIFGSAQDLPSLGNSLCDYDTVYEKILTGNVVEITLEVRYRHCPAVRGNMPCRATSLTGVYSEGALLDGVETQTAILVNNSMPGPEIRAKLGDTVRVTVINLLGEETSMHFHGITQFRTPYMDGDPYISNCPIQSGQTFTYEFVAHPAGTTFYHSHSGSQRIAGMTGPLIVEDPADDDADIADDKVVFLQDWYHQSADVNFEFWGQNAASTQSCITFGGNHWSGLLNPRRSGINFVGAVVGDGYQFQSFIVNGEGIYDYAGTQFDKPLSNSNLTFAEMRCPGVSETPPQCEFCLDQSDWTASECTESSADSNCGAPHVIQVEVGKATKLRFVHAGALYGAQVCIDGHTVDVVAADGSPVEPYTTKCFIIYSAERYDVLVTPDTVGDYWVRFTTLAQHTAADWDMAGFSNVEEFSSNFPQQGYAILRVTDAPGEDTPEDYVYLPDKSPISCDVASVNCGEGYWFSAKTMGCAVGPSRRNPERCITVFDALKPAASPNDDATLCGDKLMGHQVEPTVRVTAALSFLPDEVPRWQGISLNSRIEIMTMEEWGFPYITPNEKENWGVHQPISFVNPDTPPLSLDPDARKEIYARRFTFRDSEASDSSWEKDYPKDFGKGVLGVNVISANYGDVVRVVFTCTEPYGPGCAMPHPMHLHGHRFAVLYEGAWNETYNEAKFKTNPLYRDTVVIPTDGFVVVQLAATNPGLWRWHCHVNIHHRSGMAMLLDVGGPSAVEAVRATPDAANLCPKDSDSITNGDSFGASSSSYKQFLAAATVVIMHALTAVFL